MSQAPAASTVASNSGWQTSPCDAVARFRIASLMLYLAVVPRRSCTTFTPTETVESAWVTWANSGAYDAKSDWQIQPGVYPRSYVRASSRLNYVPQSASAAPTHLPKGQNWKLDSRLRQVRGGSLHSGRSDMIDKDMLAVPSFDGRALDLLDLEVVAKPQTGQAADARPNDRRPNAVRARKRLRPRMWVDIGVLPFGIDGRCHGTGTAQPQGFEVRRAG